MSWRSPNGSRTGPIAPPEGSSTGKTGNLGVVVPDLSNPFFPTVLKGRPGGGARGRGLRGLPGRLRRERRRRGRAGRGPWPNRSTASSCARPGCHRASSSGSSAARRWCSSTGMCQASPWSPWTPPAGCARRWTISPPSATGGSPIWAVRAIHGPTGNAGAGCGGPAHHGIEIVELGPFHPYFEGGPHARRPRARPQGHRDHRLQRSDGARRHVPAGRARGSRCPGR